MAAQAANSKLLEVSGLTRHVHLGGGFLGRKAETVYAVDGISFDLGEGEQLGLVVESGFG